MNHEVKNNRLITSAGLGLVVVGTLLGLSYGKDVERDDKAYAAEAELFLDSLDRQEQAIDTSIESLSAERSNKGRSNRFCLHAGCHKRY